MKLSLVEYAVCHCNFTKPGENLIKLSCGRYTDRSLEFRSKRCVDTKTRLLQCAYTPSATNLGLCFSNLLNLIIFCLSQLLLMVNILSRYLIVRNVPALGCGDDLMKLFANYGDIDE